MPPGWLRGYRRCETVAPTTVDPAYNTVSRDDFPAMIAVERYGQRSAHFDDIIARTDEHFWDPEDRDYIRFDEPWPNDQPVFPLGFIVELHSAVADKLDEGQKVAFANASACWTLSNI